MATRRLFIAAAMLASAALIAGVGVSITAGSSRAADSPAVPPKSLLAQSFSVPGTYTYAVPHGVNWIEVQLWGAGGGGGSTANVLGGAGGGVAVGLLPVTSCSSVAVTVGAGGSGGVNNGSGGHGQNSTASCATGSLVAEGGDGGLGACCPGGVSVGGFASATGAAVLQTIEQGSVGFPHGGGNNGGGSGGGAVNGQTAISVGGGGGNSNSMATGSGGGGANGLVVVSVVG